MVVPSSALWWKNSSPRSPPMNPKPLSAITFLIVPCGMLPLLQKRENPDKPPSVHPEPVPVKEEYGGNGRGRESTATGDQRPSDWLPRRKSQGDLKREHSQYKCGLASRHYSVLLYHLPDGREWQLRSESPSFGTTDVAGVLRRPPWSAIFAISPFFRHVAAEILRGYGNCLLTHSSGVLY